MGGLPPVFIEFLGKSTGVKMAMRDIKSELRKTAAEGETGFTKFGKIGQAAVMGLGVAAVAVGVKTVRMASDFQTQMTRLQTAAGLTTQDIAKAGYTTDSLNQKVLALGSQVGMTGTQMAEALYHPISAGLDLGSALQVVKYSAEEAKISGASLDDTTYALSSVMKAFNRSAKDAGPTMAELNAIVGQGDMRFQDFNESVKNWAPTASQMGISVKSMGAGLAYLTDRGNSAEVASTRLTMGITMMSTPSQKATGMLKGLGLASTDVKASSAAMEMAMKKAGITQNQLAEDLKKPDGLYVALNHLKTALKNAGVSGTEADSVLSKIFGGGRSDKAIMSLMQNLDGVKTKFNDISRASNMSNFNAAWAKTQQTFSAQFDKMKASIENLGIAIGLKLLPTVSKIVSALAKFAGFLVKHKTVATALAIVIGVILVAAIVAATVALWGFITSAAVLEAIPWVAAITAIIIIIVLLATHWKQVWHVIKEVGLAVWHALEAAWHAVVSATVTAWHAVSGAVVSAWHAVAAFFVSAYHWVVDPIVQAWNWVKKLTISVWDAISGFFKKWWPLLLVIFAAPIAILMATWNHFHKQIESVAKTIWNGIKSFFAAVWGGIKKIAGVVWDAIKVAIIQPIMDIWHFIVIAWHTLSGWLTSAWHGIERAAGFIWGLIKIAMINPLMSAWHTLTSIVGNIASAIWNGLVKAWNSVKSVGSWFLSIGKSIVEGIINGIENAAGSLFDSLRNLAGDALNAAKSFLGINSPSKVFAMVVGKAIPEGVAKGVTDHAYLAHSAVRQMAGNLSAESVSLGTSASGSNGGYGAMAANGQPIVINLNVTAETDEGVLFKILQKSSLQHNRRNLTNGLSLARG